jgi:hypothetical protein
MFAAQAAALLAFLVLAGTTYQGVATALYARMYAARFARETAPLNGADDSGDSRASSRERGTRAPF